MGRGEAGMSDWHVYVAFGVLVGVVSVVAIELGGVAAKLNALQSKLDDLIKRLAQDKRLTR